MTPSFEHALATTLLHEGLYSRDPDDPGGQTFMGISRVNWPDWCGWEGIDELEAEIEEPVSATALQARPELLDLLREDAATFYRTYFWRAIRGDDLISHRIASEVFDTAVNCGVARASSWLQEVLNVANDRARLWPDITEDGAIGPRTLAALRAAVSRRGEATIVKLLNLRQGIHYWTLMRDGGEHDPDRFEKYIGWYTRVQF